MPYQKLTHEKCQEKICAVCFEKSKRKVSKATIELIKEHTINKAYDISDSRLPTGICETCYKWLFSFKKTDYESGHRKEPYQFDHSQIPFIGTLTRSNSSGSPDHCMVCQKAKENGTPLGKSTKNKNPIGRPRLTEEIEKKVVKRCTKCQAEVRPLQTHICSPSTFENNLYKMTANASSPQKERLITQLLKEKVDKENLKLGCTLKLRTKGRSMNVKVGKEKLSPPKTAMFSHETLLKIQNTRSKSNNEMKKMAHDIRVVCGKKSIEKGFREKIVEVGHSLDHLFKVDILEFVKPEKKKHKTKKISGEKRKKDNNEGDMNTEPPKKKNKLNKEPMENKRQIENSYGDNSININENKSRGTKRKIDFENDSGDSIVKRPTYYCTDVEELIGLCLKVRKVEDCEVQLTADGGGGFFSVNLLVVDHQARLNEENIPSKRSKYSEGVAARQNKDTSVKKMFVLAKVPDIDENHTNVRKVLSLLNLSGIDNCSWTKDIKLVRIFCGKQLGRPKKDCPWCNVSCDCYEEGGELYTVGDLRQLYEAYVAAGRPKKRAKEFDNVVNMPLWTGPDSTLIIEVANMPELHFFIGDPNHIMQGLEKVWGFENVAGYARYCGAVSKAYQGGGFEGNQVQKLLAVNHLQKLQSVIPLQFTQFVVVLKAFASVVKSCFGFELQQNWEEAIVNYRTEYLILKDQFGVTVTVKTHCLWEHVPQFIRLKGTALGIWSEQAGEAHHSDWKPHWKNYAVNLEHESYPSQLERAGNTYNARHL